jgi:hypothetical protein
MIAIISREDPSPARQDPWCHFAEQYLHALDQVAREAGPRAAQASRTGASCPQDRAAALAEWHVVLLDELAGPEAEGCLDRIARHQALGGPELKFFKAQLAHRRGDVDNARTLVRAALARLPGHRGFLDFAQGIDAPVPPRGGPAPTA